MEDKKIPLEIERKFLIRFPDIGLLNTVSFSRSEIIQTYLVNTTEDSSSRIRLRNTNGQIEYTKTEKKRVSDMTRVEYEDNISREDYEKLLNTADPNLRAIEKTRWCINYKGLVLEVDVLPFWKDRAFLEIELEREDQKYEIPDFIHIIKEVTDDRRYTNKSLAKKVLYEEIESLRKLL